jgi:hypothetical protein
MYWTVVRWTRRTYKPKPDPSNLDYIMFFVFCGAIAYGAMQNGWGGAIVGGFVTGFIWALIGKDR